jgi:putative endopeptidase
MKRILLGLTLTVSFIGSSSVSTAQNEVLDRSTFDSSVRVQDDLFMHVNGAWLQKTEIPSDKSNYGSFIQLDDLSRERIKGIVEKNAETKHEKGSIGQKVGDFYNSFLNEAEVNEKGISPVRDLLKEVTSLDTHEKLITHFGKLGVIGVGSPIGLFIGVDEKKSTDYLTTIAQSGTTLPDRDYYLKDDQKYVDARKALVNYINKLFELAQIEATPGEAILNLEKQIAEAQWSRIELRDANKTYNKYVTADLAKLAPKTNWKGFFEASKLSAINELNVMTPSFFEKLDGIIQSTPVEVWQQYLQYRIIDNFAPFMAAEFDRSHFELHQKQLAGIPEQQPRWKRGVTLLGGVLGEAVGKLYVEQYFKPEAKARMNELVQNLLKAFDSSIDELEWMTATTKKRAKEKLSKITTKIGYPDEWRDYSKLEVVAGDLVGNVIRAAEFEHNRQVDRLGKPVDRKEWGMTPQTVNAYYNPTMNEIVFPAAILQSPFFDMNAPEALNYGGIGAVIGHEISHAFDDQGSQYDGDGNLKNWWSDEDRQAFESLTKRLVAQYEQYEPLPGKKVQGQLTLGENIADLSGLSIAFKAYKLSQQDKQPKEIAGWNGDQLFFIGWSRVWQRKYRDAEMVKRLATDPHSPSQFRANGPVTNIDAFYEAFKVKEGDKLFKPVAERIRIW